MLRQLGQIQGSLSSRSFHAPLAGKFVRASAIAGIGNVPNGTPAGVRLATGSCRRIRIGLSQLARGEGMKIRFVASPKPAAQSALQEVIRRYGQTDASDAEATVTVGGDGTALKALHAALLTSGPPVFAMRLAGSVGFLANRYDVLGLPERIEAAYQTRVWALEAEVFDVRGAVRTVLGISEIVLRRQQLQAAKLKLSVAGAEQMRLLVGDGLLIATPLGSTGYDRSLGGARLLLDSPLMAMTGLALHPASEWSNAVVADHLPIQVMSSIRPTGQCAWKPLLRKFMTRFGFGSLGASFIPCFFVKAKQAFCDRWMIDYHWEGLRCEQVFRRPP